MADRRQQEQADAAEKARKAKVSEEAGKYPYKNVTGYPTPLGMPSPAYGSQGSVVLAKIAIAVAIVVATDGVALPAVGRAAGLILR